MDRAAHFSHRLTRVALALVLISLVIVSCKPAPQPTQTPIPATDTAVPPTATTESQVEASPVPATQTAVPPTAQATVSPPTIPPTSSVPTATPSGPLPIAELEPALISQRPYPGEELSLTGKVDLTFNQPMDRASVEQSLQVEPEIAYTTAWINDTTLQVIPAEGTLQQDREFTVTVGEGARGQNGITMPDAAVIDLQTVGSLQVTEVIPGDSANDVSADALITVMFNRPVVPLVIVEDMDTLPQPLIIEPALPGEGEWLNTSIYIWHPAEGLMGGTTYTVTVDPALRDPLGSALDQPYSWTFSTEGPEVINVSPQVSEGYNDSYFKIKLDQAFRVEFNQPMDRASTQAAFTLRAVGSDQPVTGSFEWEDEDRVLVFKPSGLLTIATTYKLNVSKDATNQGGAALKKAFTHTVSTLPLPKVNDTYPDNNDTMDWWTDYVYISFNTIMDEESLLEAGRITIDPATEGLEITVGDNCYGYYDSPGCEWTHLEITGTLKPRTKYTITLNAGARDIYGNTITEPYTFTFRTKGLGSRAQINLNERYGLYDASLPTSIVLTTRNTSKVDFKLYRMELANLQRLLSNSYSNLPQDQLLRTWTVQPQVPQDEMLSQQVFLAEDGGALPMGLYLLVARIPGSTDPFYHVVAVTNANLTYKYSFDESLGWLTDLRSGQPIQGAEIKFYSGSSVSGSGITDANGVLENATPHVDSLYGDYWRGGNRYAVVDGGGIFAIAFDHWDSGITPHSFGMPLSPYDEDTALYIYTDRPIYRPGQELFFKGIIRQRDDMIFSIPQTRVTVAVCLLDENQQITKLTLDANAMGTFNGAVLLPETAVLGEYAVIAVKGTVAPRCESYWYYDYSEERASISTFRVAEYRKPEFEVSVTAPVNVIDGATVQADVHSRYFFGSDMPYGEVEWQIQTFPYSFDYTGTGNYSFIDPSGPYYESSYYYYEYMYGYRRDDDGRYLTEGSGTANDTGNMLFEFSTDIPETVNGQRYHVQAQVTDAAGNPVVGSTDVIVHNAQYYVGIQSDRYVSTVGQSQRVNLIVVDWNSKPVRSARVQLQFVQREWERELTYDEYEGRMGYKWVVTETNLGSPITVTTNARGEAVANMKPPQGGSLKIRATVTDPQGNTSSSSTRLWVFGGQVPYWRTSNTDDHIDIAADKTRYAPGETASIVITSPYQGEVKALITIERGSILSHEVITFSGQAYTYKVPITAEHIPNIFVSVVLMKGADANHPLPSFRMGMTELQVAHDQQTLKITLTPSSDVVLPGSSVIYDIQVTDAQGNPVAAELSLALVDRAVLSLAPPNSEPIDAYFYEERGVSVVTAVSLTAYVPRLEVELLPEGGGGGAGGGGPPGPYSEQDNIRDEFEDTAYWSAMVVTNDLGEAQVSVQLPENTTSWRLDARAVTADTRVGQSTVDITATLPLLIRPVTPRFFVVEDRVMLSAVVNNNTDSAIRATVMLEATGLTFQDGVEATQTVTVPANNRVEVVWPVIINYDAEWVDLTFHVTGGGHSDAVKPEIGDPDQGYRLPVYRYEVPETVGTAGQIIDGGARIEGIVLPPEFDVTRGEVTVNVSPSLAASSLDSLTWLQHYPYECSEQVASRVLPNALTLQALRDFQIDNPTLEANLQAQMNVGLTRLYARQNGDGGWGWWPENTSHPYVTAYVLHALIAAQEAGEDVPSERLELGFRYLTRSVDSPLTRSKEEWSLNRATYLLYVLSLAEQIGDDENERISELYDIRDKLSLYAQALLAQILWRANPADPRLETIKSDLVNAAVLSATGAHWEESYQDYWNWNTDTRTTAIVLDTFAQLWPENDLAPNATRWLMVARDADHWETTQETVWALIGITDWMRATGELDANYNWSVTLNDASIGAGQANRDTVTTSSRYTINVNDLLTDGVNRLTFTRDYGEGRLYYTTHLTAYLPVEHIDALSRGVSISRRYLDENGNPVTEAFVGDTLTVELSITAPNDLQYVLVEDYYPAGADAVDSNLLTEGQLAQRPEMRMDNPLYHGWGWWSFSHIELRDEKAVLSADYLPRGNYVFTYQIRLGVAGEYRVIPAVASEFYFPEVYGRSDGMIFTVKRPEAQGISLPDSLRASLSGLLALVFPLSALVLHVKRR